LLGRLGSLLKNKVAARYHTGYVELSIAIYAASGKEIGFGHLKRCLSIAEELRGLSYQVKFLIDRGQSTVFSQKTGFPATSAIEDRRRYNMIIVDKYSLDQDTLVSFKKKCDLLVRIDDGAPPIIKDNVSDVLINGNPYASRDLYDGVVKKNCRLLVGSKYVPMDRKLCQFRNRFKVRETIGSIVVTFGSSSSGIMYYAYNVAKNLLLTNLSVNILLPNGKKIEHEFAHANIDSTRIKMLPFMNDIGRVFLEADLAVCSASTTCWQLAALGVPFIAFETAINQRLAFEYIKRTEIGVALGNDSIWNGDLERNIELFNKCKREYFSTQSRKRIDCNGSRRIASQLDKLISVNRT
jgi:UDP-2,4-diacetamido-2,4,6-trideoxy-beta-L-altropyranose hydrolase